MFKKSTDSFKITSWKQQKTSQSQRFWSILKKHIEEATDLLSITPGDAESPVGKTERPIMVNSNAPACAIGNILTWNVSQLTFDYSASHNHSSSDTTFTLSKNKEKLFLLQNGKKLSQITDVDKISIKITSVVISGTTKEESLQDEIDSNAVASIIEIAITLKPPDGYMAKDLRVVQNHKFRVNVKANSVTNP